MHILKDLTDFVMSNPYIDELKQSSKFLIKYLIDLNCLLLSAKNMWKVITRQPKLQGRLQKVATILTTIGKFTLSEESKELPKDSVRDLRVCNNCDNKIRVNKKPYLL